MMTCLAATVCVAVVFGFSGYKLVSYCDLREKREHTQKRNVSGD